ncbi:hypothetical protein ACTT1L_16675 [Bacillus sp. FH]
MRFGIYLGEECVGVYYNIFDAYEDAKFCTEETGAPHEVKIIKEDN